MKYTIEDGLFKAFCNKSSVPVAKKANRELGLNKTPTIWKVSLWSTGDNPTRAECLENGHIRIGWDDYGAEITEDTDFSEQGGKKVLNAFPKCPCCEEVMDAEIAEEEAPVEAEAPEEAAAEEVPVEEAPLAPIEEKVEATPIVEEPAPVVAQPEPAVVTPVHEVTEIQEDENNLSYNKSMSVEEICASGRIIPQMVKPKIKSEESITTR